MSENVFYLYCLVADVLYNATVKYWKVLKDANVSSCVRIYLGLKKHLKKDKKYSPIGF